MMVLGISVDMVIDELIYNIILEWDFMVYMILIVELENVFDVMLDIDDIIDMSLVVQVKFIL